MQVTPEGHTDTGVLLVYRSYGSDGKSRSSAWQGRQLDERAPPKRSPPAGRHRPPFFSSSSRPKQDTSHSTSNTQPGVHLHRYNRLWRRQNPTSRSRTALRNRCPSSVSVLLLHRGLPRCSRRQAGSENFVDPFPKMTNDKGDHGVPQQGRRSRISRSEGPSAATQDSGGGDSGTLSAEVSIERRA